MLCAAALVAMPSPLACFLATRQDWGPCDVNPCYAVIDSSACWNAYVTGAVREELTGIYDCAPGSEVRRDGARAHDEVNTDGVPRQLCGCPGCDSRWQRVLLHNELGGNTAATASRC